MTDHLAETAAEIAALIPQYSWAIMDEEQRDDLVARVVLPRYMRTTVDGVSLGPTFWAEAVGASAAAIRNRILRLQQSRISANDERSRADFTPAQKSAQRHAKTVLSDPEQRERVIGQLAAREVEELARAATEVAVGRSRAQRAEHRTEPTAGDLMGDDPFDPAADWVDTLVIRVNRNARELSKHVAQKAFVLGSMPLEEAYEYLREAERLIAEVRALVQERVHETTEV